MSQWHDIAIYFSYFVLAQFDSLVAKDLGWAISHLGLKVWLLTCGCDLGQVKVPSGGSMLVLNMQTVPKSLIY